MSSSVIVTIVIILGIIVAGGFLLYFMGDLLMSLSNKDKDKIAIQNNQLKRQKELEERVNALEMSEQAKKDPQIAAVLVNGGIVENYDPNEGMEKPEEPAAPVEEKVEQVPVEEPTEEETAEEDETAEYIRKRRLELMERLSKLQQEETAEEAVEETPVEETVEEPAEETVEEPAEETPVEETPVEEPAEEEAPAEETIGIKLNAEQINVNTLVKTNTLEELEEKLAQEQEKLKTNEKELRQCKKDYLPLRKVKKTLENDEKKLRRKEALVAKQKVVLYGVNNYADIDEEKAKKLAEDLDLLDGLKLSVQHCEEVISKNKERYPLLEKIYNLLSIQNEEIKANIEEIKLAIETLKNQTDGTGSDAE